MSFDSLHQRAKPEPNYTELWEVPQQFRGVPLRLRLNVRRVLEYEAPKNDVGVTRVYEAWGWTDNSKSFPFVVVLPEKPPELPVGPEVNAEVVFVGYFLKNMAYSTVGRQLAAPLLVGKAQMSAASLTTKKQSPRISGSRLVMLLIAAIPLAIAFPFAMSRYRRRTKPASRLLNPGSEPSVASSFDVDQTDSEPRFDLDLKL